MVEHAILELERKRQRLAKRSHMMGRGGDTQEVQNNQALTVSPQPCCCVENRSVGSSQTF